MIDADTSVQTRLTGTFIDRSLTQVAHPSYNRPAIISTLRTKQQNFGPKNQSSIHSILERAALILEHPITCQALADEVQSDTVDAPAAVEAVRTGRRPVADGHVLFAVVALETGRALTLVAVVQVLAHAAVLARIGQAFVNVHFTHLP